MKSNHQCRVCGRHLEGEWNRAAADSPERDELQRQMDQGHCDGCNPVPALVLSIVQKAYNLWDELRWLAERDNWTWVVTPEILTAMQNHPWKTPDPDDERYPPGYKGPVRAQPDNTWTLFGVPITPATHPMNHNEIELRIRR